MICSFHKLLLSCLFFTLIFSASSLFAKGSKEKAQPPAIEAAQEEPVVQTETEAATESAAAPDSDRTYQTEAPYEAPVELQSPVTQPPTIINAFRIAYPENIQQVFYDEKIGDWVIEVNGKKLCWAEGRFLPEKERLRYQLWRPIVDYLYTSTVPNPKTFSPELIARLDPDVLAKQRKNSPVYHVALYDALYQGSTRNRIEQQIVRIAYMGKTVSVHKKIVPMLRRVEKRVYELAKTNSQVKSFLAQIVSVEGYNWREIVDSPQRSNHSWGIAIDILPRGWSQKNVYWQWPSTWNKKWMLISLERRWMPPEAVIEAFEKEGFIWGGKWLLWDTIHFEYRPELLVLLDWGYEGEIEMLDLKKELP